MLFTCRPARLAGRQTRPARFQELALPVPYRLLGHLRSPGRFGHGELTGQDRQHDPRLLLGRNSRWFRHDSDSLTGQARKQRALPQSLTRDTDIRAKAKELAHGGRGWGRYHAINTRPPHTFELRIFASSLQRQQVQAALGFAHASVEYTRTLRAHDITRHQGWDWTTFTAWAATRPEYAALTAELTALGATGSGVSTGNQEDLACAS